MRPNILPLVVALTACNAGAGPACNAGAGAAKTAPAAEAEPAPAARIAVSITYCIP